MAHEDLLARLEHLRRAIHRRLLAYGVCAVLAGGVASFLTVVTLDWLLWFPAALRLIVAVLFFTGFVLAAWHWVLTPLRARVTVEQVAARLERRFDPLRDRLSSTVQFLTKKEAESSPLAARVVRETESLVAGTRLEQALTPRPLFRAAGTMVAAGCGLVLLAAAAPAWVHTGWQRYTAPLGPTEWPRTVEIEPLTGDLKVALGESAAIRMRVRRGLTETLRGVLRLQDAGGPLVPLVMQRVGEDGEFHATVDAIGRDLKYWFEAGDDSTESSPRWIRAVPRPEVLECLLTVEPPPYALGQRPRTHDLKSGAARAPVGGFVTVAVRASKPLDPRRCGLRLGDGAWEPLVVSDADPARAVLRRPLRHDLTLRAELTDREGFENRGGASYSILAEADRAPVCLLLEPQTLVELTPKGKLSWAGRAEDDHGLSRMEWIMERPADGSAVAAAVDMRPPVVGAGGMVEASAQGEWDAAPHALNPGETVYLVLSALDNCPAEVCPSAATEPGQRGRSAPLPVRIISETEMEARTRDEIAALETRLHQVLLDQTGLRDAAAALAAKEDESAASTAERAAAHATGEARLVRAVREITARLAALRRQMERNPSGGDEDARRQIAQMETVLTDTASGPMTAAATLFTRAAEALRDPSEQRARLKDAEQEASEAVDRLRGVMQMLARWGDFQGVLARTRDLLDRQQDLRAQTLARGRETLGKSVKELTAEEAAELQNLQRRQEQLGEETDQSLRHMEQLAARMKDKDPTGAEAMDAAMRSARAQDLIKRMRAATADIGENRTAAAAIDQQAAAETLKRMVAALRKREERELELLRKRLLKAEEQVAELLDQQKSLRAETDEAARAAADPERYEDLADRQRTLRRNARLVADDIGDEEKMTEAARLVRAATLPMGEAEVLLQDHEGDDALRPQDEAVQMLTEAVARLAALEEEVAEQAMQRHLAQIQEDLQRLLARQQTVNRGVETLHQAVAARGRVDRGDAREAARLAREQSGAQEILEEIRPELQKVPVFDWALHRVAGWMQSGRDALEQRKIDESLLATGQRIERELEKLIRAVHETQSMPLDTEFAEAESGGGGSGGASRSARPIPTVAELLVLKAMQQDIQQRTRAIHDRSQTAAQDEGFLRELRTLGEDQNQVRQLAEMLTARIRGK